MDRKEELDLIFDHLVRDVNKDVEIADPKTRALFCNSNCYQRALGK